MRKVLAGLSVPALLVISACGAAEDGGDPPADDPEPSAALPASECVEKTADVGTKSGKPGEVTRQTLAGVTVTGEPATEPKVKIETPLSVEETEIVVRAEGDGEPVPEGAEVTFNYAGYIGRTGEVFDSSWTSGEPLSLPTDQLVPGFSKAMIGNPVGSQVLVTVAPDDGYGPMGGNEAAGIKADDTLVFVMDIVSYSATLEKATGEVQEAPPTIPQLQLDEECVPDFFETTEEVPDEVTESSATVLVKGKGAKVEAGQEITVHYLGQFYPDGEIFDESWDGEPATFGIGVQRVIACWDELVVGETVGSRLELICTPEDAYGPDDFQTIPGGSTLTFAVDILASE